MTGMTGIANLLVSDEEEAKVFMGGADPVSQLLDKASGLPKEFESLLDKDEEMTPFEVLSTANDVANLIGSVAGGAARLYPWATTFARQHGINDDIGRLLAPYESAVAEAKKEKSAINKADADEKRDLTKELKTARGERRVEISRRLTDIQRLRDARLSDALADYLRHFDTEEEQGSFLEEVKPNTEVRRLMSVK